MIAVARARQAPTGQLGAIAMTPGSIDVRAVRRHFTFPEYGRIATNNAASTQPPRELLALYQSLAGCTGQPERDLPAHDHQDYHAVDHGEEGQLLAERHPSEQRVDERAQSRHFREGDDGSEGEQKDHQGQEPQLLLGLQELDELTEEREAVAQGDSVAHGGILPYPRRARQVRDRS